MQHTVRKHSKKNLTVAAETESVVPFPGGQLGGVVVAVALSETTVLLSNAGKTTSLPALVHRLGNPVNPWVAANLYARIPSTSVGTGRNPKLTAL